MLGAVPFTSEEREMHSLGLSRYALAMGAASALLAGCGGSQPLINAPGAMPQSRAIIPHNKRRGSSMLPEGTGNIDGRGISAPSFRIVYSFRGGGDGAVPRAGLTALYGTLYGTTSGSDRSGTVFSVTTTGTHNVLHYFAGGSDGADPNASLIAVRGSLYGTTYFGGGREDGGTVFRISPAGQETILHDFGQPGDGRYPEASLVAINGVLYGTTYWGGIDYPCVDVGCGTVFSVSLRSGLESLLYEFRGSFHHTHDGQSPQSNLIVVNGKFYGTTLYGGSHQTGTIFELDPVAGKERVAYSFARHDDGGGPGKGLVESTADSTARLRAVVSTTRERFSNLTEEWFGAHHSWFRGGLRRIVPGNEPRRRPGILNGTTEYGGGNQRCLDNYIRVDCGTVFSISPSGDEKILHRFGATRGDSKKPAASLIYFKKALYGTTTAGGMYRNGTIFALRPWVCRARAAPAPSVIDRST